MGRFRGCSAGRSKSCPVSALDARPTRRPTRRRRIATKSTCSPPRRSMPSSRRSKSRRPHVKFIFATTEVQKIRSPSSPAASVSTCRRVEPEVSSANLKAMVEREGAGPTPRGWAHRPRGQRLDARCPVAARPGHRPGRGAARSSPPPWCAIFAWVAVALVVMSLLWFAFREPEREQARQTIGATQQSSVERGQYLVAAANCVSCHTAKAGTPFAGGRPLAHDL